MSSEGKTRSGIEGYKLLSKLGKGGMATVYLGVQECFDRQVAIKVMHPNAQDKSHGERFIHEAKVVAKLNHPNIVSVYDVGISGKFHYMAMEYLPGGDLSERIAQGLSQEKAISITKALASALDYAHSKGYLHRDVKPDNILFKEDGTAVLTDFGIAKAKTPNANLTQIGQVVGTPKYMSPEQSKGAELDAQSDLYALGVLLYEMLTGNVPFDGDDAFSIGIKHLKDPAPPLPEALAQYQHIIDKLLAKNPAKRFTSGQALIDALNNPTTHTTREEPATMPDNNDPSFSAIKEDRPENLNNSHKQAKPKKSPLLAIIIVFAVLISSAFASVFFAPSIAPNNAWLMSAHKQLQQILNPELAQLEQFLAQGEKALTEQRLLSPEDNSALFYFTKALSIDNNNAQATSGLDRLEKHFIDQALAAIEARDFSAATTALDDAHSIRGETEAIMQTRELLAAAKNAEANAKQQAAEKARRLAAQKAAAEKAAAEKAKREQRLAAEAAAKKAAEKAAREKQLAQEQEAARLAAEKEAAAKAAAAQRMKNIRITGLLNKAKTYMARGDYRSPAKENALEKYQAVLQLDPNNSQAQQGIDQVVQKLLPELKRLHGAQQISMAQNLFEQLINAAPDHPELIALGQQYGW